jgi:hypothetical protein
MANKKISQLFENPYPRTGDIFPIVQDGVTYKVTLDNLNRFQNDTYFITHNLDPYILDDLNNRYGRYRFISGNLMISGSGYDANLPHPGSCVLRVYDGNFILNGSGIVSGLNSGVTDLGHTNNTKGLFAVTIGQSNVNDGPRNEIFGSRNSANGNNITIVGENNYITGTNNHIHGHNNILNSDEVKIFGNYNTGFVFSTGSFIVGKHNYVGNSTEAGANNLVYGDLNHVSGKNSLVFGRSNLIRIKSGALEKISVYGLQNDVSGIEVDVYGRLNLNSGLINQIYGHSNTGLGDINFTLGAYNRIERLGVENYLLGDYIILSSGSGNYIASRNTTVNGNNNHVVGQHLNVSGTGNWIAGNNSKVTGIDIIAVGKDLNLQLYSNFSNVFGRGNAVSASGYYSDIYGSDNTNSGQRVIILGKNNTNTINGYETTILGRINDSYGEKLVIVGERNIASGFRGYVFGYDNDQNTLSGYTIGEDNLSSGTKIYIFGLENVGTGTNSEIFGTNNQLSGNKAFIFGTGNVSFSSHDSSIFGNNNTLNAANHSHAFGSGNQITNTNISVVYGHGNSLSTASRAQIFGSGNTVSGNDSATFGYGNRISSTATRTHTFGLQNIANANNATIVGSGNASDANNSATFGYGNTINSTATRTHTFGFNNTANGAGAIVVGRENLSNAINPATFGYGNTINSAATFAHTFGMSNTVNAEQTTVVGRSNTSSADYSAIFGYSNTVEPSAANSYTLGLQNINRAIYGYVFGKDNIATGTDSYTFGQTNVNSGVRSHVNGRNNQIENAIVDVRVFGDYNRVRSGQGGQTLQAGIIGNNNILASNNPTFGNDSNSYIYGNNSQIYGYESYSYGNNNTIQSGSNYTDIFGSYNFVNMDENVDFASYGNVIFGKSNNIRTGVDNGIYGLLNNISQSNYAFVYGLINTVSSGLNNVVVLGKGITIPKSGNAGYKLSRNNMDGAVQIGANNSGKITILENGNIGFGTSGTLPFENPQELIHVRSGNVLFDATEGGYFKFYDKNRYDNIPDNPSQVNQPGDIRAIVSGGNFKIDGDIVLSTGIGETGQFLHGRIFQEAIVRNLDGSMWCYTPSDLQGNCNNASANPYSNATESVVGTDGINYTHKIGLWQPYGLDLGWDTIGSPTVNYVSGYVSGFIAPISIKDGAIAKPDFCNGDCNFDYQPHEAGRIEGRAITFLDGNPTSAIITGRYTFINSPIMKTTNLYLPPVNQNSGVLYTVKNLGKGNIMVFSTGSEKIDLFFTGFMIDQRFASYEFLSNGSGWFLV